ncbi:MAG TPA: hypothetical protein VKY54_07315 [Kiloniellales bacterium]|jgi:hypothetical protein|nr:hypothetical protein [Kiloniellales bacterium]
MARDDRPRKPGDTEVHRAKRGKNLAVLAALVAFIVIVYFVSIIRMGG